MGFAQRDSPNVLCEELRSQASRGAVSASMTSQWIHYYVRRGRLEDARKLGWQGEVPVSPSRAHTAREPCAGSDSAPFSSHADPG